MATRRTPQPGPRKGARPGSARPQPRTARASARPPVASTPRPRFTNRMAVLVLVAAVLVVSYASSMRAYLQQRSQIDDLRAQMASSQAAIKAMEREKRRWADPAYVEQQARDRFGWVLPGETSYQVIGKDGRPLEHGDTLTNPATVAQQVPQSWWSKVYGTVQAADHPQKKATPATRIQAPKTSP